MLAEIWNRCDAVEECYEFMLAYAAQGLPSDQGSESGGQVREFLHRAVKALAGLSETCAQAVKEEGLEPADKYLAFFAVLDRDARALGHSSVVITERYYAKWNKAQQDILDGDLARAWKA